MPWAWISEENGFCVTNLPTRYGPLDFTIRADGEASIRVTIGGSITLPPGGLTLVPPLPDGKQIIAVDTQPGTHAVLDPAGTVVAVISLPFAAEFRLGRHA